MGGIAHPPYPSVRLLNAEGAMGRTDSAPQVRLADFDKILAGLYPTSKSKHRSRGASVLFLKELP
jgi:hypothetical protein